MTDQQQDTPIKRYAIADYLSDVAKRAACSSEYALRSPWSKRRRTDTDTRCPLGRALFVDTGYDLYQPSPLSVAHVLSSTAKVAVDYRDAERAAGEFIADWDAGRIRPSDLPAALGLATGGDA